VGLDCTLSRVAQPIFDRTITWLRTRSRLFQCISRVYEGMFCVWHLCDFYSKVGCPHQWVCCFCHFEAKRNNCLDLRKKCVYMYKDIVWFWLVFSPVQVGLLPLRLVVSVRVFNKRFIIVCLWFWSVWSVFRSVKIKKRPNSQLGRHTWRHHHNHHLRTLSK